MSDSCQSHVQGLNTHIRHIDVTFTTSLLCSNNNYTIIRYDISVIVIYIYPTEYIKEKQRGNNPFS